MPPSPWVGFHGRIPTVWVRILLGHVAGVVIRIHWVVFFEKSIIRCSGQNEGMMVSAIGVEPLPANQPEV